MKIAKFILWIIAGMLASKVANDVVFAMLNDATTGVSAWRAMVPAVCGSSVMAYCGYRGYKAFKAAA